MYSKSFTFDVKANETYRMIAFSNKKDGFFLESKTDGKPLFRMDIKFIELEEKQ